MTVEARELRRQATALSRAADRLTILRLRLANTIIDVSQNEDPATRELGEEIHEHWTLEQYPELGRVASGLRASAKRLDAAAIEAERSKKRRLGGYQGAGFLGKGDEAHRHVEEVAAFVGTQHGASIGGYPLRPSTTEGFLAHPSHILGIETPDYDETD